MKRENEINNLLKNHFSCEYLDVLNESDNHSVPPNSETHFKITLVSEDFIGKSKVSRHQSVYALVQGMMAEGLHAVALHTYEPSEWQLKNSAAPVSPNCMGGSK